MDSNSSEYRPFYGSSNVSTDRPLFGVDTTRDRIINHFVGAVTSVIVAITLIMSFSIHHWSYWGLNVYFSISIIFLCLGHLILVYWYRQGDLDPKFRNLIYINSFAIIQLCICAMCYINLANDTVPPILAANRSSSRSS